MQVIVWLIQCAKHVLGVYSPSTGRVVPWPWEPPPEPDYDAVLDMAYESIFCGACGGTHEQCRCATGFGSKRR